MKIIVDYEHDPAVLTQIWMATTRREPTAGQWLPAYRDTIDGVRVIWVKTDQKPEDNLVWVRDGDGVRRMRTRGSA